MGEDETANLDSSDDQGGGKGGVGSLRNYVFRPPCQGKSTASSRRPTALRSHDSSGYILEDRCVKNRETNIHHEHCLSTEPVNGEGKCPGDLSHVTE